VTTDQILSILRSWDKIEKATLDQIAEELKEADVSQEIISNFNQMTQKMTQLSGSNNEILSGIEKIFNNEDVTRDVDILRTLIGYIDDFGVLSKNFKVNPCLARGLSYYTGPIFETVIGSGIGSVTGGGRFDNLIETLGGPSIPATGSSFGLERILGVMDQLGMNENETNQIDVFVTVFDPNSQEFIKEAVQMATLLRSNNFKTEISMGQEKIGKQLKLADRRGAKFAIIVGPEEMESGNIVVKKLAELAGGSKENQVVVKKDQLIETLGGLM
jgi:histidyl-tRNA synthetase